MPRRFRVLLLLSILRSLLQMSGSQKVMAGNGTLLTISHIGKDIKTTTPVIQCSSRGSLYPIRPPSSASFSALSCSSPIESLEHAALVWLVISFGHVLVASTSRLPCFGCASSLS
ncbi:hypothetical protein LIER_21863 [Lithospermum erythrorhizon]|uniref:Secreted protein n=1 Tax=Lithospermum erythrorhizon TaxID=34254 RepID=A0AAV3QRX1_LITER